MPQLNLHIGQGAVSSAPAVISARGLGSCVALALYDDRTQTGGMAHVMFPNGGDTRTSAASAYGYADTVVLALLAELRRRGSDSLAIKAKMAGGARMFEYSSERHGSMGDRTVAELVAQLNEHGVPIAAMDVGGNRGRNVSFDLSTGMMTVRSVEMHERTL